MTENKEGPWSGGPDMTLEEELAYRAELEKKKKDRLSEKINKRIDEEGFYRMDDEDDIAEVLSYLVNK